MTIYAEEFYLDYIDNYPTVTLIAEHYGISKLDAYALIDLGRKLNQITTN